MLLVYACTWLYMSIYEYITFLFILSCRCRGRYLELQRQQQVITQDTRFIKLQEIERYSRSSSGSRSQGYFKEDESSRIPKTFEIECRGNHLINFNCSTGDVLQVVGVVRSVQEKPRYQGGGGGRGGQKAESGLHNITIIANSLSKLPTALLSISSASTANNLYSHGYLTISARRISHPPGDAHSNKRSFGAISGSTSTPTSTPVSTSTSAGMESRRNSVRNQLLDGISRLVDKNAHTHNHTNTQFVIPNSLTSIGESRCEQQDSEDTHSNPDGSKHKSTGLFILDENFQGNTCITGTGTVGGAGTSCET